ncbi:hypothetical protein KEU06_20730 [Pseudaminobacter sp. 19-2017]|uniref:Uncharacterized protein n=1 Tax=Pseudaminobacter soli (ex Zhang et al. 2022) TaxID=2831468 RepID=A0A942E4K7_9HYPH|nr:hypothetical protein [Pseudaminobacter soli]MBS3651040.1 hypothetical protein [Pseudaminobacter soli]
MLDRKKPFFTESYVNGSAVFRDFYSTYEKAYEAAQDELKDASVSLAEIGTRDFSAAGEYEGTTLLWLEAVWRDPWKAESVLEGEVGVIRGTEIDSVIARSPVDVEYDLQGMCRFVERLSPPLGVLTLVRRWSRSRAF